MLEMNTWTCIFREIEKRLNNEDGLIVVQGITIVNLVCSSLSLSSPEADG